MENNCIEKISTLKKFFECRQHLECRARLASGNKRHTETRNSQLMCKFTVVFVIYGHFESEGEGKNVFYV